MNCGDLKRRDHKLAQRLDLSLEFLAVVVNPGNPVISQKPVDLKLRLKAQKSAHLTGGKLS